MYAIRSYYAPSDGDLSLITTNFVMNGGSLISRMFSIKGNANVKGGSILCTSGIISIGDFTMSGGTLKTSTGANCSLAVMGQFTKTGYIGYELSDTPILGALVATLGIFLPGFLLLLGVLKNWQSLARITSYNVCYTKLLRII